SVALSAMVLVVALLVAANSLARAQDNAPQFAPRDEMISAIVSYANSGGCETLRNVFGPVLDSVCHNPHRTTGFAEHVIELGFLRSQPDGALVEICKKYRIRDCEKPPEISRGRPILTFVSALDLMGGRFTPTWSPDG